MKSNLGQFQYIYLFGLLLIAPWGYAGGETPFFEEEIPQQKMVMSQRKSIKIAEKDLEKNAQALANTQEVMPSHQLMSPASQLIIPQEHRRGTPANQAMLSETMPKKEAIVSTKNPHQSSTAIAIQNPVDIIPEQGQFLQTIVPSSGALQTTQSTGKTKKKEDIYAFNRVMQWVTEVSMNMFTFSGEHLHRDRHAASQFFSPDAWERVDQFLFHRAESPFLDLKKRHANSRAMTLDWPIALHTDTSKHGKIWWIKVPVSVMFTEGKARKRAFFEVKLGVLPIKEDDGLRFIAEDVIIKQVDTAQLRTRGRRNGR